MSYAEYRRQGADVQASLVDRINAELKDAGIGPISHEIGHCLILRGTRVRGRFLRGRSLAAFSVVSVTQ